MIFTLTLNPALDYAISVCGSLKIGEIHRTAGEDLAAGGKGINVSWILSNLGVENVALGFIAGFTGEEILKRVENHGSIKADFIKVDGLSRINVKISSARGGGGEAREETDINGQGPFIPGEALDQLFLQLAALKDGDALVLAGSVPSSVPEAIYASILQHLNNLGRKIYVVVDTTKALLINALSYHPFLIKPNNEELGDLFGAKLSACDKRQIVYYAKELQKQGARHVLVSLGGEGSIFVDETGEICLHFGVAEGSVKSTIGSGDSMLAGFLAGLFGSTDLTDERELNGFKKENFAEALKLGTACGSATAFSIGLGSRKLIEETRESLKNKAIITM